MKRTARGRVFPHGFSTDRRIGRLSLSAVALFPLMWAAADDQGRLSGDPEEVKYECCPNIDHLTKAEIPDILIELETQRLIKVYDTPRGRAIQLLDWWSIHLGIQWAWPSEYPPMDGWQDRLRYKKSAKEVVTYNWASSGEGSGEQLALPQVNTPRLLPEGSGEETPLTTPVPENESEEGNGTGRGRGRSPEGSGEETTPSPASLDTDLKKEIFSTLVTTFKREWGIIKAERPDVIIPREPSAREEAQLRDLAIELSSYVHVCPGEKIRQAFREAAGQNAKAKMSISYVRAILFDWLGLERDRSP